MGEKPAIEIMIVDDHEVVRRGLASYIQGNDDFKLVASVGSGEEAVRMCPRVQPDIVIIDPNIKVVALLGSAGAEAITQMFAAGAAGFLLKGTPIDDLPHLMHTIYAGRLTISPEVMQVLHDSQQTKTNKYNLSEREFEVLNLISAGYNNPQIAEKLFIARSTVGFHVSSIIHKLGVQNRMEVTFLATKENLIADEVDGYEAV